MKLKIKNTIKYHFSNPVSYGIQRLRLRPRIASGQINYEWSIDYFGAKEQANYFDQHNNHCTLITFLPRATEIIIRVSGIVKSVQKKSRATLYKELCPIWVYQNETFFTTAGKSISDFCGQWANSQFSQLDLCQHLAEAIKNEIEYRIGETNTKTTAEEAFRKKKGVCQDLTHIFITCMRHLNYPARYVSGYLAMEDSKIQNATHAWAEVYLDALGWVGFDLANDIQVDSNYIILATGCDYREANPIDGFHFDSENDWIINQIKIKKYKNRNDNQ